MSRTIKNTAFKTKIDDTTDAIRTSEATEHGALLRTETGIWAHHNNVHVKLYPQVGSGEDVTVNNFTITGGLIYNVETISDDKVLGADDHVVFVNKSSGGNVSITLPLASSYEGKVYIIRVRKNSEDVTLTRSGSDQIDDGALETSITISEAKSRMLISDGISTWYSVDNIGQ